MEDWFKGNDDGNEMAVGNGYVITFIPTTCGRLGLYLTFSTKMTVEEIILLRKSYIHSSPIPPTINISKWPFKVTNQNW